MASGNYEEKNSYGAEGMAKEARLDFEVNYVVCMGMTFVCL